MRAASSSVVDVARRHVADQRHGDLAGLVDLVEVGEARLVVDDDAELSPVPSR